MERHVIKFGTGSLAITLPKKWTDKKGLNQNAVLQVVETAEGNLVLSTSSNLKREAEEMVEEDVGPEILGRLVGLHYMYGTHRLKLYSKEGFSQEQAESIESKIQSDCPGYEIEANSKREMVIGDITDMREVSADKLLNRLKALIDTEFKDIIEGNEKYVKKSEGLVNRFYMLGIRYINIVKPQNDLRYFKTLELLEQLSDKMTLLAEYRLSDYRKVFEELRVQFGMCFSAFDGNVKAITAVVEARSEIIRHLKRLSKPEARLINDITDYMTSIAEFGMRVS
jgi:hypothetical protein